MLVYSATKREFVDAVRSNQIAEIIENEVRRKLNRNSPNSEKLSWENSLQYMAQILWDEEIPSSAGVAIEYSIPLTNRRVDFILTGKDSERNDVAVIVELKQWEQAEKTNKDAVVKTFLGGNVRETNHPSYQAWSYSALIEDYNETVRHESISLRPCAYLHNMKNDEAIRDDFYKEHLERAPAFLSADALKLADFLKRFVRFGDTDDIMYRIEHGVIKPSKNLADALSSMLQGNQEFLMIDEQKLVYEETINLAHKCEDGKKRTLIVRGGPGTGKSVVAINLLVELTQREKLVQYVSKNAAPRAVFTKMLTGTKKKSHIDNMFKGSGSYIEIDPNYFDALLIDEAHRLNEKSGLYGNLGENQIMELISGSKLSVFFIDEDQRVTLSDIGSIGEIKSWAKQLGSEVFELDLVSQFRCNGSDGYLAWLDNTLQVRETANPTLDDIDYEVKVFDDPNQLRNEIRKKNRLNNKARMVAGYCWDWNSNSNSKSGDPNAMDIVIPEYNFEAQWNLASDGSLWLIAEESVEQIGCIHTCQGLELDYIGVIIGDDFVIRKEFAQTDASKRSGRDRSIRGYKKLLKENPEQAKQVADQIIKNTYRTLMTRGQKGCYIFCTDPETNSYFKAAAERQASLNIEDEPYPGLHLEVVSAEEAIPYQGVVPLYNLDIAAGGFSDTQFIEEFDWVKLPEEFATNEGMFVARAVGESMNKRIPNGAWCLFKANPGGTRNGKVVLVQHRSIEDPDHGGNYTVKVYNSDKKVEDGLEVNSKITLKPDTNAFGYSPIKIEDDLQDIRVIGELIAVL